MWSEKTLSEIKIIDQPLPGLTILQCPSHIDERGDFRKIFHYNSLKLLGINILPAEIFLTRSKAGVIRGMHFQVGEAAHDKLVFCPQGRILDVVVDIRAESPNFNKPISVELSGDSETALVISKGYGHGFLALEENSCLLYSTTTVHCPALDRGVLWSSIDFNWPTDQPIVSKRDNSLPPIQNFR